jgi:DMSO reductase anchor subunit
MRPHPSILYFTVLAGLGQGFFVALLWVEALHGAAWTTSSFAAAAWGVLALLAAGLVASAFHLGRPERAWRAASQWRTSWLSREVIVLPALMAIVFAHAALLQVGEGPSSPMVRLTGVLGVAGCVALWGCTGMIYACLRMVQAWATALTPLGFLVMGLASGVTLCAAWFGGVATPVSTAIEGDAARVLASLAAASAVLTLVAALVKAAWWSRQRRLVPKSTLQSALAIPRPGIRQLAMGMTGGSFNTREFFHGASAGSMRVLPWAMVGLGAALPLVLATTAWRDAVHGAANEAAALLGFAVAAQVAGLLVERWLFFAVAQHPQNLYYQRAS